MTARDVALYLAANAVLWGALAMLTGCGASAISLHARAAIGTAGTLAAAHDVIDGARSTALDRVEAEYPTDPEHDVEVLREASRWRPVALAMDMTRAALLTWIAALEAARVVGGGEDVLPSLLPVAARVLQLYADVVRLATELGAEGLPGLPAGVLGLATALGGGR